MPGTNHLFPTIQFSGKQSFPFYGRLKEYSSIYRESESLANGREVNIKMEAVVNALSELMLARQWNALGNKMIFSDNDTCSSSY